MKFEVLAQF